jgi:hypothetical protein
MIETLTAGMRVLLPSGNVVALVRCERSEWVCGYTALARARGEVVFTGLFLRTYGQQA